MEPQQLELPDTDRFTDAYEIADACRVSVQSVKLWKIPGFQLDPNYGRSKITIADAALFVYERRRKYWPRFIQKYPECDGMFEGNSERLSIGQLVHEFDLVEVDTSNLDQVRQGLDIADKGLSVLTKEMRMQVIAGELVKRSDVEAQQHAFLTILEDTLGPAFVQRLATMVFSAKEMSEGEIFNLLSHQLNNGVNEAIDELQRMFANEQEQFADIAKQAALDSA